MILQSLNALYDRLPDIAPYGYARKPVSFTLVLDPSGRLVDVHDERTAEGKRLRPRSMIVPDILGKRSVNIAPNLACENSTYMLGSDNKGKPKRTLECFRSFRSLHEGLARDVAHPAILAAAVFLRTWDPRRMATLKYANELVAGGNIALRLQGAHEYLHEVAGVREWWTRYLQRDEDSVVGPCLVSGVTGVVAKLHPRIAGVKGCQSAGAGIVNFNLDSFNSYGKVQGENAPISIESAFRYSTALNWLLDRANNRYLHLGDASLVFWTAAPSPIEGWFGELLAPPEDESTLSRLKSWLESLSAGEFPQGLGDPQTPFYILGLSPNSARIAVRLWLVSSVQQIAVHLAQHYKDLQIVPRWASDRPYPPVWLLLKQVAAQGDDKSLSPLLGGSTLKAILGGGPYPVSLLEAVIRRIRARDTGDRGSSDPVGYLRVAMIKAYLNRRFRTLNREEVTVALDPTRADPSYRLGRLFAMLELVQRDALGDPGASITDRYYASASATPRVVFPRLIRLSQHHLGKLAMGHRIARERTIQEICGEMSDFPAHLSLEDQGLFALGYYHQKQSNYAKKEAKGE